RPDGKTSPAYEALMARWRDGAVVSGSSAGAAVMSDPMIASGTSAGAITNGLKHTSLAKADSDDVGGAVMITTGLGFFPAALADQHFLSRGRFGRLLVALLELEHFDLGFGIDENTALVVDGGTVWPAGASGVIVMDERGARRNGRGATGVRFHMLSSGDRFDLEKRMVSLASTKHALAKDSAAVAAPKDVFARWEFLHVLDRFARSSRTELAMPVNGGEITIRKGAGFRAVAGAATGVQNTPSGLAMTGLSFDLRR
ncbi:MAG TPA: Type 1 glutamine amidotransferase-like domain-containing protein, partial [Gemmatimonadaceae bacterium]